MRIRPALASDAPLLPAIERSAAQAFKQLPSLTWMANSEVIDEAAHLAFIAQGASWLAVDEQDRPLGFLCATVVGDVLHIRELSVQLEAQGQGLGRRLLDQAARTAHLKKLSWLTLTTFADVPWNGHFYQRYGFKQIAEQHLDVSLQGLLTSELAHGLTNRCAMQMPITPEASGSIHQTTHVQSLHQR